VGEAFHRFFAADDADSSATDRQKLARDILDRWEVAQLQPSDLLVAADRLRNFLDQRWGGPSLAEWPVHAIQEEQVIAGRLDLVVEVDGGYAVIDHKSFPGSMAVDDERLRAVAGQLALYGRALATVSPRGHAEYWIHQPIAAVITRIELV
jgi:ATP-dependent exoDNAse (exonuclease V) beta subunit